MRECGHRLTINAPPAAVLDAFFDPDALKAWWQVARSVCLPRALGSFAVEWESTRSRDELLGRLGGALHGTVVEFVPGRQFFIADLYWHPPEGDPIGPMALEATCKIDGNATVLQVRQSGYDKASERWARYYDIMSNGWVLALGSLKEYLEARWA
jgi:uncharacterized protein YndB with AHSA1/START domain